MVVFNWLHLTDLHIGKDDLRDLWLNVEVRFIEDLKFLVGKAGPLDLVLFTGDLVQCGSTDEFNQVNKLLERLWRKFSELGWNPKLLAVPGNHDLVRPEDLYDPALIILTKLWNDPVVQKPFWDNPESAQRKLVNRAFANYIEWWQNIPVPKLEVYSKGLLPGDFSATLEKEGIKLGIVGLNSSFLQLIDDNLKKKLALSVRQFHEACGASGPDWVNQHDLCLLLTHHPPDWLTEEAIEHLEGEIHSPPRRFALHLYGHMHELSFRSLAEGGSDARHRLQGCSLFSMKGWGVDHMDRLHGYSLGQIKIEANTAKLRIWPRIEVKKQVGGWSFDRDQSFSLSKGQYLTKLMPVTLLRPRPKLARSHRVTRGKGGRNRGDGRTIMSFVENNYSEERSRYLQWIKNHNSHITLKGIYNSQIQPRVSLDQVYVPLEGKKDEFPGTEDFHLSQQDLEKIKEIFGCTGYLAYLFQKVTSKMAVSVLSLRRLFIG